MINKGKTMGLFLLQKTWLEDFRAGSFVGPSPNKMYIKIVWRLIPRITVSHAVFLFSQKKPTKCEMAFMCGVCMFSMVLHGFFVGSPLVILLSATVQRQVFEQEVGAELVHSKSCLSFSRWPCDKLAWRGLKERGKRNVDENMDVW